MSDVSSELKLQPRERNWASLNLCLGIGILVSIGLPLAYRSLNVVTEREIQEKTIADLEGKLARSRMLNARLNREMQLAATDPDYLETYARDHVTPGYMKKGEIIFRLPEAGGTAHD